MQFPCDSVVEFALMLERTSAVQTPSALFGLPFFQLIFSSSNSLVLAHHSILVLPLPVADVQISKPDVMLYPNLRYEQLLMSGSYSVRAYGSPISRDMHALCLLSPKQVSFQTSSSGPKHLAKFSISST